MSVGKHPRRPLRSSGPIERGKAKRPRAAWRAKLVFQKPKVDDFARKYGSKARVEFINTLPCVACGVVGYSQNAHVVKDEAKGMGRKAGYLAIAPLCGPRPRRLLPGLTEGCHAESERSLRAFAAKWGVDLKYEARRTAAAWLARGEEER